MKKFLPSSSGLQRRSERESLLGNPTSDEHFKRAPPTDPRNLLTSHGTQVKAKKDDDDYRGASAPSRPREPFVAVDVPPGATLQSLALKYNVPTAELKRLNNLLSENELYALKKLKVPVKPSSLLSEHLPAPEIHSATDRQQNPESGSNNGWMVEHFASSPSHDGTRSSEISSPTAISDESGDNLAVNSLDLRSQSIGGRSQNRQLRKTRKLLRDVDKDIAQAKVKNLSIRSTVIGQATTDGWDLQEEDEDDEEFEMGFLGNGTNESSVLLLPSQHSVKITSAVPQSSKLLCVACVILIVVAVIVILIFSEYEYEEIEHRNRTVTGSDDFHDHHHLDRDSKT